MMKSSSRNKGFALITLVIAMTLIAFIGAGFVSMVSKKQEGFTYLLKRQKANMAARAGIEWAIRFASDGGDVENVEKNLDEESSFKTSYDPIKDRLTVDGTYQRVTEKIKLSHFQQYLKPGDATQLDVASFKPVESQAGKSITVGPTGVIRLGQGVSNTSGAVWYGGNSTAGNCVNGVCDFGSGFRAYFVFQYAPGSQGDGFTFAITNGANNTANSIGGDSNMGELMAYGGDSRSYNSSGYINSFVDGLGNGLRPPKFAVEFDIYPNTSCPADSCGSGRCDLANEHMAYVFWGDNNKIGCNDDYTKWISSFSFLANTIVYGTTGGTTYLYRSTDKLTTGTTEPTWPSGKGYTVTESGVPWKECSWRASTNYSWYSWYIDVVAPRASYIATSANGFFFRESRLGSWTTGSSEPNWTNCVDSGDECVDSQARWKNAVFYDSSLSVNYATNSRTYDDDKHTAGTGTDEGNSTSGAGPTNATLSSSYYTRSTNPAAWLADRVNSTTVNTTYAYRMEVVRNSAAGTYRIKSWIAACDPIWSASTPYAKYDQVRPTVNNEYYYAATSAGTSGGSEPTWPASGTVTDGTVTWEPILIPPIWSASAVHAINDQVRPTVNNGYYYVAASAGTSGATEPTWPASGTVTDGTVTWVPTAMLVCNKYTNGMFGNVRSDYTADSPTLDRTITLDATYNAVFDKFLFGWTTASGGATQKADVWKFRMTFKP